jgi:diguanylate cyclase (GGDEF)-like protein
MPSSGASTPSRLPAEDSYLELLADTLEGLEVSVRAQFLERYFRSIAHIDVPEVKSIELWDQVLARRHELSDRLARPVALKTALMDVLSATDLVRVPVIIEYEELKRLELNAVTDPLTGLYNRRLFTESLEKELNRARRYGNPLGLVILDLHSFKEVNDMHGHPRGDEVLLTTAHTLRKSLRTSDSAFRIGGDEFALLLPQTDQTQAHALSRRMSTVFSEAISRLQLSVGVALDYGLANFPEDAEVPEQLVRMADERLYRLKHENHRQRAPEPTGGAPARPASGWETPQPPAAERTIAIDSVRPGGPQKSSGTSETPESSAGKPMSRAFEAPPAEVPAADVPRQSKTREFKVTRKAERVSMAGTNAYAVLGEEASRRARVIDLGFGGVALEIEGAGGLADNTLAVLHVPILPPVRVNLRPVWSEETPQGTRRVGCAFVS